MHSTKSIQPTFDPSLNLNAGLPRFSPLTESPSFALGGEASMLLRLPSPPPFWVATDRALTPPAPLSMPEESSDALRPLLTGLLCLGMATSLRDGGGGFPFESSNPSPSKGLQGASTSLQPAPALPPHQHQRKTPFLPQDASQLSPTPPLAAVACALSTLALPTPEEIFLGPGTLTITHTHEDICSVILAQQSAAALLSTQSQASKRRLHYSFPAPSQSP
eukprot:CAMPEP_0172051354 /NCGR_PEP_ID=MMETSP1043-20130122/3087_1 /TAXON_ID=464988 /ORGANISM="Hemiselmis andersenii, Strain CCMP441" /LENGTH=219 /DNA_ID=CAMNT_0012710449 /DNA_START=168 /DNA_END=829 /DNA_ORIENTATION=-